VTVKEKAGPDRPFSKHSRKLNAPAEGEGVNGSKRTWQGFGITVTIEGGQFSKE